MNYFPKLEGKRLFLAPLRLEDAEKYCKWINDPEIALNLTVFDKQYPLQREQEVLADMIKRSSQTFSIVLKDQEKLIGNCSLFDIDKDDRKAELGIMIGDKPSLSKGYGTEAIKLLLDYGFNVLNLNNIYLKVFEYNKRAMACYKKAGFKLIGNHRQARIIMGKKYDEILMDILAEEFTESTLVKFLEQK